MATTSIEWTEKAWNPVRGCSIVSPGCVNCYAMRQAHRFSKAGLPYHGLTKRTGAGPQWTGQVVLDERKVLEPLSWRKSARIFVNSMSDLFHEAVPDTFITDVFATMALASKHTFQILTKRPERMRRYLDAPNRHAGIVGSMQAVALHIEAMWTKSELLACYAASFKEFDARYERWPLPNVWLGVSCENQETADDRIPLLLQTPAAVRWVSAEPLLGPVDFSHLSLGTHRTGWGERRIAHDALTGWEHHWPIDVQRETPRESSATGRKVDWVVVGGESGAGARPFDLAWARSIVQQCKAANVPAFVKQLGAMPMAGRMPHPDDMFLRLRDRKGGDPAEWPDDLRVREYPDHREMP